MRCETHINGRWFCRSLRVGFEAIVFLGHCKTEQEAKRILSEPVEVEVAR